MSLGISRVPTPANEPVRAYAPGSPERASLQRKLAEMSAAQVEIPLHIGGKGLRTGDTAPTVMPHRHGHVLGTFHQGGEAEVGQAIAACTKAQRDWAARVIQQKMGS